MLAACAPYARWIDVFCEPAAPTAFDEDEARTVLLAGLRAGLSARVHGNQLARRARACGSRSRSGRRAWTTAPT